MGGNTFEKDLLVLIREHKGEVESLVPAFRHMYEKKKRDAKAAALIL